MKKTPVILNSSAVSDHKLTRDGQSVFEAAVDGASGDTFKEFYKYLGINYPKFYKMDNLSKLGFLCAELLIRSVDDFEKLDKSRVGVFIMNQYSSYDTDERYFATVGGGDESIPSPGLFVYTLPNILIGEICIRHHITGEHGFFLTRGFETEMFFPYMEELFAEGALEGFIIGKAEYTVDTCEASMAWVTLSEDTTGKTVFNKKSLEGIMKGSLP